MTNQTSVYLFQGGGYAFKIANQLDKIGPHKPALLWRCSRRTGPYLSCCDICFCVSLLGVFSLWFLRSGFGTEVDGYVSVLHSLRQQFVY